MVELFARLKDFNRKWNDLPRKALVVVLTCIVLVLVWASFKYLAPLVMAVVFSWLVKPIARPLERVFEKIRLPGKLGALIALVVVFGILFAVIVWLATALAHEGRMLVESLPSYIQEAADYITGVANKASTAIEDQIGEEALNAVYDILMTALNKVAEMASSFAAWLVSFTFSAVMSLPDVVLFVLFMIMECYYVIADRKPIGAFFRRLLPETVASTGARIKDVMIKGIRAQFITAILQMLVSIVILCVGFTIMDLEYALTLGLVISVMDALPVIGAGLFMFPMIIYYIVTADYMLALGTTALYLIMQVIRRILEPKLIGKQMRLSQLATMVSMYAGYVIMGYLGLLIGPLMLKLFMAILSSSVGGTAAPPAQPEPLPVAEPETEE